MKFGAPVQIIGQALLGILMTAPFTWATVQVAAPVCGSGSNGWFSRYTWCIHNLDANRSDSVVYYLHGNGGSEKSWPTAEHNQLIKLWSQGPKAPSAVITISFGASWFVNSDVLARITETIVPTVESQLSFNVKSRILLGESMGGHNAAVLAQTTRLFNRIAMMCPAIYGINPHAPRSEIDQYLAQQPPNTNLKFITKWFDKLRDAYNTAEDFEAFDPMALPSRLANPSTPLFLQANVQDPLGIYEATHQLAKAAQAKNLNIQWHSIPTAQHCQQTPTSLQALANFISN